MREGGVTGTHTSNCAKIDADTCNIHFFRVSSIFLYALRCVNTFFIANAMCHTHQEIVPDELMEIYLSIMEQGRAQSSDGELQYHCAFSLPAVVRTLGQTHWQIVKPIFELLAVDQNVSCCNLLALWVPHTSPYLVISVGPY